MELKRDLSPKSGNRIINFMIGTLGLALSISYLFKLLDSTEGDTILNWFSLFVFLFLGISWISRALLQKNAFVVVDDNKVALKMAEAKNPDEVVWADVAFIEYKINKFYFTKKDGSEKIIDLSLVNYALAMEIKEAVNYHAKKENIEIK